MASWAGLSPSRGVAPEVLPDQESGETKAVLAEKRTSN